MGKSRAFGLWRRVTSAIYRPKMAASAGDPSERVDPSGGRPVDLDGWAGHWIAVKDGKIIQAATTSHELVRMVREMGPTGRGAIAQYVPERDDAITIGVG